MFSLDECITDSTRFYLIKPEEQKKRKFFRFFKQKDYEKRIFRKDFNHAEFVGEELCNVRNLRCARFFLIGEGGLYQINRTAPFSDIKGQGYQLRLGSYDFRDPVAFDYFQIVDTGLRNDHDYLEDILEFAPTDENRRELLDEIEEMFALDTFMGQTDRYWNNVIFERNKKTKEIHLAPLYDFEYSLKSSSMDPDMMYGNVLHNFRGEEDYIAFIQEHPEFADKLKYYLDVDLLEVIQRAYRSKGIKLPEYSIPHYLAFEQERKDFIRRVTGDQKERAK